jgi:hypothetical protein
MIYSFFYKPTIPHLLSSELPGESLLALPRDPLYGASLDRLEDLHIYSSGWLSEPLSFSFSSKGWDVFYDLGAAQCVLDKLNKSIIEQSLFIGSSTGSIAAAAIVCNLSIVALKEKLIELNKNVSSFWSPFIGISEYIQDWIKLQDWFIGPENQKKLALSMTELPAMTNAVFQVDSSHVTDFNEGFVSNYFSCVLFT